MRSLFLKIFLWFWIVQILIGASMFAVMTVTRPEQGSPRWRAFVSDSLAWRTQAASAIYDRGGIEALRAYMGRSRNRGDISVTAYAMNGELLAGRPSNMARELALKAAGTSETVWDFSGERGMAARRSAPEAAHPMVLVARLRDNPRADGAWRDLTKPLRGGPIQLVILLALSGLVCYGLAHYLTSPAIKLRAATRQLANGDLGVRVGTQMGRRRDELADLGRDFDAMAEQIEGVMLSERRLLGDISHELRSPLARLNVALDLASQDADPATNIYLERIQRESERLNEMIGQLLALTRLESGESQTQRGPVDLTKLVTEVAADADFEAGSRNRRVEVSAEPCAINGSVGLLRSAVENIVRNAVRYTAEETTVLLTLKCEKQGSARYAVIQVRDHGPGVPPESLGKIFRPFYRVADDRDRKSGGTGLGLAITERAVRFHGGEITAVNAPGGGLLVEIRLPLSTGKTA